MSPVIQVDTIGKERARLSKAIVAALRELAAQPAPGAEGLDLAAFIALALQRISDGIDPSVAAWEKRGYWVKADRFRLEWAWAGTAAATMRAAVQAGDWGAMATAAARIAQKFGGIKVSAKHRLGRPWVGAFQRLQAE